MKRFGSIFMHIAAAALALTANAAVADQAATPDQKPKVALDPNQKVCEDEPVLGSRIAKKRICATRAEWAERRKQDRESIESGQRNANIGCNVINTHSGTPSC